MCYAYLTRPSHEKYAFLTARKIMSIKIVTYRRILTVLAL